MLRGRAAFDFFLSEVRSLPLHLQPSLSIFSNSLQYSSTPGHLPPQVQPPTPTLAATTHRKKDASLSNRRIINTPAFVPTLSKLANKPTKQPPPSPSPPAPPPAARPPNPPLSRPPEPPPAPLFFSAMSPDKFYGFQGASLVCGGGLRPGANPSLPNPQRPPSFASMSSLRSFP